MRLFMLEKKPDQELAGNNPWTDHPEYRLPDRCLVMAENDMQARVLAGALADQYFHFTNPFLDSSFTVCETLKLTGISRSLVIGFER